MDVTYYLVAKLSKFPWIDPPEFYCMDPETGKPSTTLNPKKAMRYHTCMGAEAMAVHLGWQWAVHEHHFPGDEPCI